MMKKIRKILMSFMLAFLTLFSCFSGVVMAHADVGVEGGYTSVLEDLEKDEKFDKADYPIKEKNYKLEVISISESVDGELFVYVYQPHPEHGKYVASSINISATDDDSLDINNYMLTLISVDGVFQKYLVQGITLPTAETRYYDVISIYRVFDETIDEGLDDDNDNTINEVVFKVAKGFVLTDTENGLVVKQNDLDVITVTDKYVGFVRYLGEKNFFLMEWQYDSHYLAFTTDKQIDELLEADVFFKKRSVKIEYGYHWIETYGDYIPQTVHLNHTQEFEYDGVKYSYLKQRIQKVEDFITDEQVENKYGGLLYNTGLTETTLDHLKDKTWVVRFYESEYTDSGPYGGVRKFTQVGEVSVLRLKFETNGVVYNLGVVDNKQSGDLIPDNVTKVELDLPDIFKIILAVLGLILLLQVSGPILPIVIGLVGGVLKDVVKIVTFPFRAIFGKKRRR